MSNSDLPIAISLVSLIVSIFVAGWTVYRDVIQKPKFKVSISKSNFHDPIHGKDGPYIVATALNLGPLPNRIGFPSIRKRLWRRVFTPSDFKAMVNPDYAHRFNTKTGDKVDVGDKATMIFPYNEEAFPLHGYIKFGIADGYGRTHWAPKSEVRKLMRQLKEEFKFTN